MHGHTLRYIGFASLWVRRVSVDPPRSRLRDKKKEIGVLLRFILTEKGTPSEVGTIWGPIREGTTLETL